jgi:NADPH:quinone reductase-like Zn-dependent oxidoreductase
MRAVVISKEGTPVAPNVRIADDWPDPGRPGPGTLIVRTEATAMNQLDLWVGRGLPGMGLTYPRVSGSDGAGIVEATGDGVDRSWIGRRVVLNAQVPVPDQALPGVDPAAPDRRMIGEHDHGTFAAKFAAPAANVLEIGDADPAAAAAFALTHLTAWRMLVTRGRLKPGQWVLIPGIGGGVALALLGIARHMGCRVIVTSRHAAKLERAAALGADHGVLDRGDAAADWSKEVRRITSRRGVDIVADSVGQAVHAGCIRSLARGGTLITCGATSGADAVTDLTRIYWSQLSILGSTMGDMDEFRQVIALFRTGALRPVIDSVFTSAEAARAFARLESGEQFGKVVVTW